MVKNTSNQNESWTISKADGNNSYSDIQTFDNKNEALQTIKELNSKADNNDAGYNACPTSQHK